ncbi:DUF4418 family protein [Ruminococcus sp.]|uniref:DUF4418 family protein n=1 Tax=Ruminococcus sp. TaxID=41978 RepID=UPI0025DE3EF6|nr:DUF4418 family protein [Ruminococcus sp.]
MNSFLKPCSGMMRMKCRTTTDIATVVFSLSLAISLLTCLFKKAKAIKACGIISALLGIVLILVPFVGSCPSASMMCNRHTMSAIRIGGAIIFLIAAVSLIAVFLKKEVNNNENR